MAARGGLITFEGGDGVGKSTQAVHLAQTLESHGIETLLTLEPGGTPFGKRVREIFLDGRASNALDARAQALLMNAARQDHLATVIRPALADGKWVVCDRFSDSTMAYQGLLGGAGQDWTARLDALVTEGVSPDLTILLTIEPEVASTRLAARRTAQGLMKTDTADRYDRQNADTREQLQAAFETIAEAEPDRFLILNGDDGELALADRIQAEVEARFGPLSAREER